MKIVRRSVALVYLAVILAGLFSASAANAVPARRYFCYSLTGPRIVCNICEFYDENDNYLGYIESCFERSL